jgi:His-Xaa-Ser system radical SAM maturase HxsC
MLVALHGRQLRPLTPTSESPFVGRISELPYATDKREIALVRGPAHALSPGFRACLVYEPGEVTARQDVFVLGETMKHIAHGDVVRIDPRRRDVTVLYRRASPSNSLLVTERCDNFCVMCSQPPKTRDDSWLASELEEVIPLLSPETRELGITGGEPSTSLHILSNGRRFADAEFAKELASIRHSDMMIGIPLYSDLPEDHDYVVQARGAFSETVRGILNLKRLRQRVELRFVVHRDTYLRMPDFARFVVRNLLFVDHVALMGLEITGFAKTNLDTLWIDPLDYQDQLSEAVTILARAGMNVSLYNHALCTLNEPLHRFARKSISDWKNTYFDECAGCAVRDACGGFFASSSLRRSRGIRRLPHEGI